MRRADRAVSGRADQQAILDRCSVLRVALLDEEGLYIVPVTFGYTWTGDLPVLYLHSAKEGRKVRSMEKGCDVAFELDCSYALEPGAVPCKYSCTYESLIGTGTASPVMDPAEKAQALTAILRQQSGEEFSFTHAQTEPVAVFRIDVETMSGKRRM